MWWRLCGKKLRSRYQMSTILGSTAYAYKYWVLQQKDRPSHLPSESGAPPIIGFVDVPHGTDAKDIAATVESLCAEGVRTLCVEDPAQGRFHSLVDQIDWSGRPWILPIRAGDTLRSGAIRCYREAIREAEEGVYLLYADDDHINGCGERADPHLKPQWNGELFSHFDFVTDSCLMKAEANDLAELDLAQNWRELLTQKLISRARPIRVPQILHHRKVRPEPIVPTWMEPEEFNYPLVSVIIPTRNRAGLLRTCVEGLLTTDYPHLEVIIVDNDSDEPETLGYLEALKERGCRVLHHGGAFNFSTLNNSAAETAQGQFLCLLNNDIEIVETHWLKAMVVQAARPEVGAVGAQLLYPDGRIQHAGVVIGMGNAAGHAHKLFRPSDRGYFSRHKLPQFISAVTAACLVVEKKKFHAVGGLDEIGFAVAFNDVDLCLKLNAQGWQSFYEPRSLLIHHESVSRGFDRDPVGAARLAKELQLLKSRWKTDQLVDPFHHPLLSRASEHFLLEL